MISAEAPYRSFRTLQTKSRAVSTAEKEVDEERIAIIEVGGTVGDIESQPFLEANPPVPA